MSERSTSSCVYFHAVLLSLPLRGRLTHVSIPAHRCHLADTMLERLEHTTEGKAIAALLKAAPPGQRPRSIYGPDMEPPTPTTCTEERLEYRCQPCFEERLREHDLEETLPEARRNH